MDIILKENGHTIQIMNDTDAINPRIDSDNFGTITYRKGARIILGEEPLKTEEMEDIFNRKKDYISLPVYAYVHSEIALNTTGFSCPWDSGQSGIIYVSREKVRSEWNVKRISSKLYNKVLETLKVEIEIYNQYFENDVWGYIIENEEGEEVSSCWGFYGQECCIEAAKEELQYINQKIA